MGLGDVGILGFRGVWGLGAGSWICFVARVSRESSGGRWAQALPMASSRDRSRELQSCVFDECIAKMLYQDPEQIQDDSFPICIIELQR